MFRLVPRYNPHPAIAEAWHSPGWDPGQAPYQPDHLFGGGEDGQEVPFEVIEDVNVSRVPVIKKGDSAFGTVTNAAPKKMMGRGGKLDMGINYVRLADQEKDPFPRAKESKGHGSTVGMVVGIAAAGVPFFPAAPLFLLMHGKDVTIPQGSEITAFVRGICNP